MLENTLLLHTAAKVCYDRLQENKVPFFSAVFVGLLCYVYAFTNKLLNHDEVQSLFTKGSTVTSGRWGLGALDSIFPNYSMPWIYGVMAVVFIAVACCLLVRILKIRSACLQALLAGSIMAFPSLTGTFSYMFTSNSFALSFLLAALAVWFLQKKGPVPTIAALGCMVLSLSIYQSYISLAASMLVVCVIRDLLKEEPFPDVLRRGTGYVLFLAASLGLYYAATQVVLRITGETFNDYAADNMGFSLAGIPAAILEAYSSFLRFFTQGYQGIIPTALSRMLHLAGLAAMLVLLILRCFRRRICTIALLSAMILVLPLAINCMYLFTTADSVHTLVLYGFVSLYALWAVVVDDALDCKWTGKVSAAASILCSNLMTLVLSVIIVCNIYLANQVWLNLQLRYENAYAFYTTLLADLQQRPEFQPETKLALIGYYQEPGFYDEKFQVINQLTGAKGFLPDSYSRERFVEYYLGLEIPFASQEEIAALTGLPQVQQMPAYPYYGSVAAVEDILVVKLS